MTVTHLAPAGKLAWSAPELQTLATVDQVAGGLGPTFDGVVEATTSGSPT